MRRPRRDRVRTGRPDRGLLRYGIPEFKMEKRHRPPPRPNGGRRRGSRTGVNVDVDITATTDFGRASTRRHAGDGATAWRDHPIRAATRRHSPGRGATFHWPAAVQQGDPVHSMVPAGHRSPQRQTGSSSHRRRRHRVTDCLGTAPPRSGRRASSKSWRGRRDACQENRRRGRPIR